MTRRLALGAAVIAIGSTLLAWAGFALLGSLDSLASLAPSAGRQLLGAVALCGLAGLLAVLGSAPLRRRLDALLAELVVSSDEIACGDLSRPPASAAGDGSDALALSFAGMHGRLRAMVSGLREQIGGVSEVSKALRDGGAKLADHTQHQRATIARAADSVLEASGSIREINESVEQLADSSRETSTSIVQMDASIRAVGEHMEHLDGSIDATSAAVSQVAQNTDQVAASVATLAEATDGTLARLGELSSAVAQVEGNARASRELSDDTSREASQGLAAVRETIQAMREISSSFGELDASVGRLASKSNSIDEILQVIRGVAEQTSLLSLNASIIAAQAGEHGRAFSVVADEINTLAVRTQRSADGISKLVNEVQHDTIAAVEAAENGAAVVQKGVHRSNEAGQVLERISEKSRVSTDRVHEISDATTRQNEDLLRVEQAMREVQASVSHIIGTTQQQRTATAEIVAAVESIRGVAKGVKNSTIEQRKGSQLITQAVTDVAGMIDHIAEATQAQHENRTEIQRILEILNAASEETDRHAAEILARVATLAERTELLDQEIGRFRT